MNINKINTLNNTQNYQSHNTNTSFGYRLTMDAETRIHAFANENFVDAITKTVSKYPAKYKNILQDNNYSIDIAPTIKAALLNNEIDINWVKHYENEFPKDSIGMIFSLPERNEKLIVFSSQSPYATTYAENIATNTLSFALAESLDIYNSDELFQAYTNDIKCLNNTNKIDRLPCNEKRLLCAELITPTGAVKYKEVIPDLIAWKINKGKYGSGLFNVYNRYFLQNLFPNTAAYINKNF